MLFNVYQQNKPTKDNNENYCLNLEPVTVISAQSANDALGEAKKLPQFKQASGLAKFPIVEEV